MSASIEESANRAYRRDVPGWYVVNRRTDLAVAGPYRDEAAAEVEGRRRDDAWRHVDANRLAIIRIAADGQEQKP